MIIIIVKPHLDDNYTDDHNHKDDNEDDDDIYVWVNSRSNMPMFCLKK